MVLWRVPSTTNIGKGTPCQGGSISRGYMVDRLRELMLRGQFSPVQKVELSMVLDTISRIIMNMYL